MIIKRPRRPSAAGEASDNLESPRLRSLARPPEAHQRNVIVLAAAGGELLDDLDHPLTQLPGGVGLPLHGGIHPFRLQLDVVGRPWPR